MSHSNNLLSIGILSSIIITALIGSFVSYYDYSANYYENINIEYEVNSCQKGSPLDTKIYTVNKVVIFHQNVSSYCGPPLTNPYNFKIEVVFKNSTIMVWETFAAFAGVTRCVCPYEVRGKISGIPTGKFHLIFIFENRYVMQTHILKEFEIDINSF